MVKLRTENDQLRRSAQAFGELAERLNRALLIATAARHAQAGLGLPATAAECRPRERTRRFRSADARMAGWLERVFEPALGFEQLALDHLRDGVPGLAFGERITELATELEELLVMTASDPRPLSSVLSSVEATLRRSFSNSHEYCLKIEPANASRSAGLPW